MEEAPAEQIVATDAEGDVEMGGAGEGLVMEVSTANINETADNSAPIPEKEPQADAVPVQSSQSDCASVDQTNDSQDQSVPNEEGDATMEEATEEAEATDATKEAVAGKSDERMEVIDNMEKIEREFSDLKERLYQDQIQWLKQDMAEVKRGTDEQFKENCKELEAERQEKFWKAEQWKQHVLQSVENMYQAELKQATDEFEAEKKHVRSKMLAALQTQMAKLEDEKNTITLVADNASEARSSARLSRKKTKDHSVKEFTYKKPQPSHINFTLRDSEVYEDLNYMSKCQPSDSNFELERWLSLAPLL